MTDPGTPGPIPPGTRDILPDEMGELRQIQESLLRQFARAGYSEVRTPTIEYAELLERGGRRGGPLYRFLDDRGELVALRNDMTVPIARLAAARMGEVEPPWRLSYLGSSFRTTSPRRADLRESNNAGIELIGKAGAEGTAEVVTVLDACLRSAGLDRAVLCVGDATLWPELLRQRGLDGRELEACLDALSRGNLVDLASLLAGRGEDLVELARTRGGVEVLGALDGAGDAGRAASGRLSALARALHGIDLGSGLVIDLGMARDPEYYSGEVFEVYVEGFGRSLGGGGRYDGLMTQLGVGLPAAGFGLSLERIHAALIESGARR